MQPVLIPKGYPARVMAQTVFRAIKYWKVTALREPDVAKGKRISKYRQ